uniref:GAF domain-containing protein n=1 Tax=Zooxanthella nutricula TaxID=1333877 RepID=A0A7S2HPK4_9DINO
MVPETPRTRRLGAILDDVVARYSADLVQVMLHSGTKIFVEGVSGPDASEDMLGYAQASHSDIRLFRHDLGRPLPVIISDASEDARFVRSASMESSSEVSAPPAGPRYCFMMALPLAMDGWSCDGGTLSVFGFAPREEMSLSDCKFLEEAAVKVIDALVQDGSSSGFDTWRPGDLRAKDPRLFRSAGCGVQAAEGIGVVVQDPRLFRSAGCGVQALNAVDDLDQDGSASGSFDSRRRGDPRAKEASDASEAATAPRERKACAADEEHAAGAGPTMPPTCAG